MRALGGWHSRGFRFDDTHHEFASGEAAFDARYIWDYHDAPVFHPIYGPQVVSNIEAIGGDLWNETVSEHVTWLKKLCIYDLKAIDVAEHIHKLIESFESDSCDETLQQLSDHYHFKNINAVRQYLESQRFLIPFLFDVRKKIEQYFGTDTTSNLELFIDPEDDQGDSKLFALILTTLPCRDASARLDQLDQEWWLEQPLEVKRAMNIDIEYLNGSV